MSTASGNTPKSQALSAKKDWGKIASKLEEDFKGKTAEEDPNVGGETAVNGFFQQIYADADDETRRAMMKSFQESGGTALSTNWEEVRKGKVEAAAPAGTECREWN